MRKILVALMSLIVVGSVHAQRIPINTYVARQMNIVVTTMTAVAYNLGLTTASINLSRDMDLVVYAVSDKDCFVSPLTNMSTNTATQDGVEASVHVYKNTPREILFHGLLFMKSDLPGGVWASSSTLIFEKYKQVR